MSPKPDAQLDELEAVLDQAIKTLQEAMSVRRYSKACHAASDAVEAAWAAYNARWDETAEERIYAPMRARIEAAAVGQPPIVQEAMWSGVSILRMSLTDKERGQLQRARRKGLLIWNPNWKFNRPTDLVCSPSIAFGGQSETPTNDLHQ